MQESIFFKKKQPFSLYNTVCVAKCIVFLFTVL